MKGMKEVVGRPSRELVKVKIDTVGLVAEVLTTTVFRDDEFESEVKETDTFNRKKAVHPDLEEAFLKLRPHFAALTGHSEDKVQVTGLRLVAYKSDQPKVMFLGKLKLPNDNASVSLNSHLVDRYATSYPERQQMDVDVQKVISEVMEYIYGGKIADPEVWQLKMDFTKDINNGGSGEGGDEEVDPIDEGEEEIEEENPEPLPVPSGGRSKKG